MRSSSSSNCSVPCRFPTARVAAGPERPGWRATSIACATTWASRPTSTTGCRARSPWAASASPSAPGCGWCAVGERAAPHHWVSGSVAVGSCGLPVGYVLWLLRGGALLASLLSSLPAWRLIDPLPVLSRVDDEDDAEEDQDAFVSFEDANLPFPVTPEKA